MSGPLGVRVGDRELEVERAPGDPSPVEWTLVRRGSGSPPPHPVSGAAVRAGSTMVGAGACRNRFWNLEAEDSEDDVMGAEEEQLLCMVPEGPSVGDFVAFAAEARGLHLGHDHRFASDGRGARATASSLGSGSGEAAWVARKIRSKTAASLVVAGGADLPRED